MSNGSYSQNVRFRREILAGGILRISFVCATRAGPGGNGVTAEHKERRGRLKNAEMLKIQKAEMKVPSF
jgi:hypothetical protein